MVSYWTDGWWCESLAAAEQKASQAAAAGGTGAIYLVLDGELTEEAIA